MQIKKELICREIAGEYFLVPVGKAIYDTNGLFVLTEVGGFLWNLLPQAADEETLVQAVLAEYESDETTVRLDVQAFLSKLKDLRII